MAQNGQETITVSPKNGQRFDENGRFAVGNPGGPGRPKGSLTAHRLAKVIASSAEGFTTGALMASLCRVGETRKQLFFDHLAARAYEADPVAVKLLDKIIPDAGKEVPNVAITFVMGGFPSVNGPVLDGEVVRDRFSPTVNPDGESQVSDVKRG